MSIAEAIVVGLTSGVVNAGLVYAFARNGTRRLNLFKNALVELCEQTKKLTEATRDQAADIEARLCTIEIDAAGTRLDVQSLREPLAKAIARLPVTRSKKVDAGPQSIPVEVDSPGHVSTGNAHEGKGDAE